MILIECMSKLQAVRGVPHVQGLSSLLGFVKTGLLLTYQPTTSYFL